MLYKIQENEDGLTITNKFLEKTAEELGVREKTIENWLADHIKLLFPSEDIFIIGQSIAGQGMADLLALDSLGNLIIVEIKRDWSDRKTVAQLLEYAAGYRNVSYERLNQDAKKYEKWRGGELIDVFREFVDNSEFRHNDIGKSQRIFIVAPQSDQGLKNIVDWLRDYQVPIEFIPFRLLADEQNALSLIEIEGASSDIDMARDDESWAGHWIFNTNETNAPGAYERMFNLGVIAIFGYPNGGKNFDRGARSGDKVFAYVNKQGLRALGLINDPIVKPGEGIFLDENGNQQPEEYHLKVKWTDILLEEEAVSSSEAESKFGYRLPIRTVFGKMRRGTLAQKLENEMKKRDTKEGS